ncbi:Elongator subunit elp6 [Coemansia sp. RSA 2050]|nr:Elongator subunit elp6 [Coemansia sp. RSA 2050]KAJ2729292.1 Elongator subunit elp6 [Coemansia sp. BCRC 34962]
MATYKTLSSSLNWSAGLSPLPATTTLIAGGLGSEGSVLIPHFLNSAFDNKLPVVLISFTQTYNHYVHILRKMGVNLLNHQIQFVNALRPIDLSSLPPATRPHFTLGSYDQWPEFYAWLEEQPPSVVVIDGLCSLLDQGHSLDTALSFFTRCQSVIEAGGLAGARLVVNMLVDDEGTEPLAYAVVRRSHYVLSFKALSSGASSDISGQLTAVAGHLHCQLPASKSFKPMVLHYKVSDTTVLFFSPGQSRIVL